MKFLIAILFIQAAFLMRQPAAKTASVSAAAKVDYSELTKITTQIADLDKKSADLEKKYLALSNQITEALEELKKIKAEEQSAYEKILDLEREKEALEETKRNLKVGLNDAEDNAVLEKLDQVKNYLNNAEHDLEIEAKKYKDIVAEIALRIKKLQADIAEIKADIKKIEGEIAVLGNKIKAKDLEITNAKIAIKNLVALIGKLEQQKDGLEADKVKITEDIAKARVSLNTESIKKTKLENDVSRAKGAIVEYKNHIAEEKEFIAKLEAELAIHKKKVELFNAEIAKEEKNIIALNIKIADQVKVINAIIIQINAAIKKSEEIQKALELKVEEIKKKKQELINKNGDLKKLQHELSDLEAEMIKHKAKKTHYEKDIVRHNKEIDDAKKEEDAAKKAYDAYNAKISPYIKNYKETIEKLKKKQEEIKIKRAAISQKIKNTEIIITTQESKIDKQRKIRQGLKDNLDAAYRKLTKLEADREVAHHGMEDITEEKKGLEETQKGIRDFNTLTSDITTIVKEVKNYE